MTATPPPLPARARGRDPDGIRGAHPDATNLARLRWAVRAALTLGVTASVAANVLHARPNLISQIIAAWPPLALLLTVELISRVPAHRRGLATARLLAAAVIAGIAAWVSYFHMAGVAARYGETDAAASYLLPISVDGLVVVASISLVEIAGRIRASGTSPDLAGTRAKYSTAGTQQPQAERVPAPADPPASSVETKSTAIALTIDGAAAGRPDRASSDHGSASETDDADADHQRHAVDDDSSDKIRSQRVIYAPVVDADPVPVEAALGLPADTARTPAPAGEPSAGNADRAAAAAPQRDEQTTAPRGDATDSAQRGDGDDADPEEGAVPSETPAAVAFWYQHNPSMHPAEIAAKIGRSERTVRRYWPPTSQRAVNGHEARHLADGLHTS